MNGENMLPYPQDPPSINTIATCINFGDPKDEHEITWVDPIRNQTFVWSSFWWKGSLDKSHRRVLNSEARRSVIKSHQIAIAWLQLKLIHIWIIWIIVACESSTVSNVSILCTSLITRILQVFLTWIDAILILDTIFMIDNIKYYYIHISIIDNIIIIDNISIDNIYKILSW